MTTPNPLRRRVADVKLGDLIAPTSPETGRRSGLYGVVQRVDDLADGRRSFVRRDLNGLPLSPVTAGADDLVAVSGYSPAVRA